MNVKEWLGEDNKLGIDIWEKKYRYNNESFNEWLDRVSNNDTELRELIIDRKFLFGGRALSNRNTDGKSSYFNCYSSGYCPDDFKGILEVNSNLGLTYKAQGGQGVSLSKLRPKGTSIGGRYTSDGILPFLELFNKTTEITSQGGSRKGALLVSLDIRHKEAEDFITIKTNENSINKANLSLEIDDEFMSAVQEYYINGKEITLHEKREYSGHIIEYDIVPIKLYKLMMKSAYDWAEPACIFTNRFRNYNLMEFDDDYQIETCNPCGEQPLAKDFCCNLGSLNLSEFIINPYRVDAEVDYKSLERAIDIAIRSLDILVDENADYHPLEVQRINSLNYRNIGLGVMGFGTALFKLGIKYGSEKCISFTDDLFNFIFRQAVRSSSKLAKEKGSFPKYKECVFDSEIIKLHFTIGEIESLKENGIRNCSLLSIAPTGSIGTMLGITGGCEPEFALKFKRKTESLNNGEIGYYDVYCNAIQEYKAITNDKSIPDYFISSADIKWKDRVNVQAIMQKHIDTAISSTVNLPKECLLEEIEALYLYAWSNGIKGITIYRDGCKREGILTTNKSSKEDVEPPQRLRRGDILEVNDDAIGKKRKLNTGCGSLHCTAFFDPVDGTLLETYLSKGSSGGCNNFMIGLSRMISLATRAGVDIDSIVDQLNSSGACPSYAVRQATKHDASKGACCPMAVGNAIKEMWLEMQDELGIYEDTEIKPNKQRTSKEINNPCPQCGAELQFSGGCNFCPECSYSKCD